MIYYIFILHHERRKMPNLYIYFFLNTHWDYVNIGQWTMLHWNEKARVKVNVIYILQKKKKKFLPAIASEVDELKIGLSSKFAKFGVDVCELISSLLNFVKLKLSFEELVSIFWVELKEQNAAVFLLLLQLLLVTLLY